MTGNIDLEAVEIPPEKDPTEYTYAERRAEIFRSWCESTDPYADLNQTDLAERYEMATSTIHDDFNAVKAYVRESIGIDDELKTDLGYDRAIKKLEEQGRWYKAAKVRTLKWEWLYSTGLKEKAPEKVDVDADVNQTTTRELDDDDRELALEAIRDLQRRADEDSQDESDETLSYHEQQ